MPTLPRPAASRLLAGVAGFVLLASGCGGGSGSKTTSTTPTSLPVSTTAPPPGQPQLQAMVLQQGDLPTGWSAKPASPPADPKAEAAAFAQCVGGPSTFSDQAAVAYSPNFVKGTSFISSTATSFKSPADIQTNASALANPKASACYIQVVKARATAALPKGTVKSVTFKITPGAGAGPANVIATATGSIVFTSAGKTLTLNNVVVFFAAPRTEAHVDFFSIGSAIPASVKTAVINKVSARVQTGS
jgi:hypothetical protein